MLLENERCTMSAGVPTIFTALLTYLREGNRKLSTLKLITIGGAACPPLLLEVRSALPAALAKPEAWLVDCVCWRCCCYAAGFMRMLVTCRLASAAQGAPTAQRLSRHTSSEHYR